MTTPAGHQEVPQEIWQILILIYIIREDPPSRLAKMGALPTPFRAPDKVVEDTPSFQAEREEPRSETPPGKHVSLSEYAKLHTFVNLKHQYVVLFLFLQHQQSLWPQKFRFQRR